MKIQITYKDNSTSEMNLAGSLVEVIKYAHSYALRNHFVKTIIVFNEFKVACWTRSRALGKLQSIGKW